MADGKQQIADRQIADGKSATSYLGRAALAGVLLAIATLAGHIQATLFIVLALVIYTGCGSG